MIQSDVTGLHVKNSSVAVDYRTRLRGITVTSATVSARNIAIADPTDVLSGTWSRTGTLVTVTIPNNGLSDGDRVFLDVATGTTMRDGVYDVSNAAQNTFTVTSVTSGNASGTVDVYTNLFLELDTYNTIGLPVKIPGDGILCENGIFVGLGANVTATIFHG